MSLSPTEYRSLRKSCKKLGPGEDYRCDDYVLNMLNTALDFQMNADVVNASMDHFSATHGIRQHAKLRQLVDTYPNTKTGNVKLANSLWNNNHWTRAQFLRELIECVEQRNIRSQVTLKRWATSADFDEDVKGQFRSKHHSIGFALFKWLQLRVGVDTVKPDLHILTFVSNAVGRKVTPSESVDALRRVAKELGRKAFRLDAAIWKHQRKGAEVQV